MEGFRKWSKLKRKKKWIKKDEKMSRRQGRGTRNKSYYPYNVNNSGTTYSDTTTKNILKVSSGKHSREVADVLRMWIGKLLLYPIHLELCFVSFDFFCSYILLCFLSFFHKLFFNFIVFTFKHMCRTISFVVELSLM